MLKDFEGRLQTYGYVVYESFDNKYITLLSCWAHARRYFEQALNNDVIRAEFIIKEIQQLYATERKVRKLCITYQQRYELRQVESLEVLLSIYS